MGYLLLSIALAAGLAKGYCGKQTSGYVRVTRDALLANAIRMVLCVVIGFGLTAAQHGVSALRVDGTTLWISLLSGVASSVFVVSWLVSVKKGAYMMLDVFLMLGVMVPILLSSLLFGETIKLTQWLGLAILLVAVFIMCSYNNSIKEKITLPALILLIISGAANGVTDFSQKLFVEHASTVPVAVFSFYTYLFSAVALGASYLFMAKKTPADVPKADLTHIFGYILVMSVSLFLNSFFKTRAAEFLPSAQLYPLSQGAALILSSIMSATLFKEKLTKKCILGLLLAFAALLIINLL